MALEQSINTLVQRLETVTQRLEKLEGQIASGSISSGSAGASHGGASGAGGADSASVKAYDDLISQHIRPFVEKAKSIAPEVGQQAEAFLRAVEAQKNFLGVVASSKKPADSALQQLIKSTSDVMAEITELREKNRTSKFFNNLSAVSEGVGALGWVMVTPTPGPHVADMRAGSEFYSNRILKDFKGKDQTQVDFVQHYNTFLKDLQTYIKNFHTTGLSWNPNGGEASAASSAKPASTPAPPAGGPPPPPAGAPPAAAKGNAPDVGALMSAINKGTGVTSGLKKVTDDMKTKNRDPNERSSVVKASEPKAETSTKAKTAAPKKPARLELEGNKWIVENFVDKKDIVISETESRHVVYIYGLEKSTVQIKGKVNSIAIDNCKRTAVVFENAISGVEIVNGNSIELQVTGRVPSVAVDKTSGIQIYLSKDSLETEIVTSKSDTMNILIPGATADADLVELPIPEQYKTIVKAQKLVTECVQHSG